MYKKIAVTWLSLVMLFSFLVIVVEIPTSVLAGTIWVDDSYAVEDTTHKKTIQAAIDNASEGDTVFVYNGPYAEAIIINKSISLIGEDKDSTIINGSNKGDIINISSDGVNVTGFTVSGSGWNYDYAGIKLNNISNCNIHYNIILWRNYGVLLDNSSLCNVSGNYVSFNRACGIFIFCSDNNNVLNNTVSGNQGLGILLNNSDRNNIIENDFIHNSEDGIALQESNENIISNNNASFNLYSGIVLSHSNWNNIIENNASLGFYGHGITIEYSMENNISNNIGCSNKYNGIYLFSSTRNILVNNTLLNNSAGISIKGDFINKEGENTIMGNNASNNEVSGIYVGFSIGNNIINNIISMNKKNGIGLWYSMINIIEDNTLFFNNISIHIRKSNDISLSGNAMLLGGIVIEGENIENWNSHDIDTLNTLNGKTVYYWKNQIGSEIPLRAGQVILANCSNIIIRNQDFTDSYAGIQLGFSSSINLTDNNASYNEYGVRVWNSNKNNISFNIITNNYYGLYLFHSDENIISDNNASNNYRGIQFVGGSNNSIMGNYVSFNSYGLYLGGSDNKIFHNNFINNTHQSGDSMYSLIWNDSYPFGGNFWSDYEGGDSFSGSSQDISGSDGIGDYQYEIDYNSVDYYPLKMPWDPSNTPPSVPINFTLKAGDQYINLTWEAPFFDGGSPIICYRIYRGEKLGEETFLVEIGNVLYYKDVTVRNGVTYYYKVKACNVVGEGLFSEEISGIPSKSKQKFSWWPMIIIVIIIIFVIGLTTNIFFYRNKKKQY